VYGTQGLRSSNT